MTTNSFGCIDRSVICMVLNPYPVFSGTPYSDVTSTPSKFITSPNPRANSPWPPPRLTLSCSFASYTPRNTRYRSSFRRYMSSMPRFDFDRRAFVIPYRIASTQFFSQLWEPPPQAVAIQSTMTGDQKS